MTTVYIESKRGQHLGGLHYPLSQVFSEIEKAGDMMDDDDSTSTISSDEGSVDFSDHDGEEHHDEEEDDDDSDLSSGSDDSSIMDEIQARIEAFAHVGTSPSLALMVFDTVNFKLPSRRYQRPGDSSSVTSIRNTPYAPPKAAPEMFSVEQINNMLRTTRARGTGRGGATGIKRSLSEAVLQSTMYTSVETGSNASVTSRANRRSPRVPGVSPDTKPWDYLGTLLADQGIQLASFPYTDMDDEFFLTLQPKHFAAYDSEIAAATRNGDLETVRRRYERGGTLLSCNRFKETVVHTICRRGHAHLLNYILSETDISIQLVDDLGRNPLHDACWTHKPNFELIKLLIGKCPDLLYISDNRGFTPLSYVGKPAWPEWYAFLQDNQDILAPQELLVEPANHF